MRSRFTPAALAALLAGLAVPAFGQVVEEIVAVVNEDIITLSEFKEYHDSVYQMMRSQFQGEEFEAQYERAKKDMLDTMITDLLLLQMAKKRQYNVGEEVKNYIEKLKRDNNIESDAQFRQALLQQGIPYEQFLKQIEENLLRQILVSQEVDRSIVVDETEGVNYYKLNEAEFVEPEEYKLRAIYLAVETRTAEELEARKAEVDDRVGSGQDFTLLAGTLGDSPLAENQGDLGFIKKGELDKALEEAVVSLQSGQLTPWVQAKNGWYRLRLEDKKASRLKPYDEVKKDIWEKLFMQKKTKKLGEFLNDLKAKNYIKILKPNPLEGQ
jgi:peptidyl-prolyl cis-trans isomerase SurA